MSDNVIPFPQPAPEVEVLKNLWVLGAGTHMDAKCNAASHQFTDPDKPCECGAYETYL